MRSDQNGWLKKNIPLRQPLGKMMNMNSKKTNSSIKCHLVNALKKVKPPKLNIIKTSSTIMKKILNFFSFTFPMYMILIVIFTIAIPRHFIPSIIENQISSQTIEIAKQQKRITELDNLEKKSLTHPTDRITDIARLAIDSGKDRIESIKETNERLFSLIAAIAAILVFFGFKGIESFNTLKIQAQESVDRAKSATEQAEEAASTLKKFLEQRYGADSKAEINVAQAVALREIADLYKEILIKLGKTEADAKPKHRDYLNESLNFLDKAIKAKDVNSEITNRALTIQGNVLKGLGRIEEALESVKSTFTAQEIGDPVARYNAACYGCLVAEKKLADGDINMANKITAEALTNLAIALKNSSEFNPQFDRDFDYFRRINCVEFLTLEKK